MHAYLIKFAKTVQKHALKKTYVVQCLSQHWIGVFIVLTAWGKLLSYYVCLSVKNYNSIQ